MPTVGFAQASIDLQFNTDGVLPSSSHGFQYITGGHSGTFGAPEASVFSVSGGYLHIDTAALGNYMGYAYYGKTGLFDAMKDLSIEMRMALYGDSSRSFHIYLIAPDLTYAGVAFESGLMYMSKTPPPPAVFPAPDTGFHTYRIDYRAATRQYSLFVDGVQVGGAETYVYTGASPLFLFGDATGHPGFNGRADIDYISIRYAVSIDIKPGSYPNSINLGSSGNIPVAILSSPTFDATSVDPSTVALAGAAVKLKGRGSPMASSQDVDGDGRVDLVVHVSTEALQLNADDTEAVLIGQTYDGTFFRGVDSVRIVP